MNFSKKKDEQVIWQQRRSLTQPSSSPSDQHIVSRTQAVDSAWVPKLSAPITWADRTTIGVSSGARDVGFIDAARIKREQVAKRSYDETPWRRLRPISIEVPWSAVKEESLTPIGEDGVRGSQSSDRYKSAIGDHDVFEYPMGNCTPQELTPYVFNWKYEDATLKSHYLQATTVVEDWLRETHKSYPQTLTKLLSKVSARPFGVMPRQGRSRLGD